ncbi:MAG: 30S ribosomal protein S16 [Candidatus Liptonbacteria bacterium]|nr:30S ribosomal protein S16 [Candidatus Liptonbacteria bacterium]
MLCIKLRRIGKKKQASFRIIVAEGRSKLNGRFVEDLGWVNPHNNQFKIETERVKYWVSKGAQPTKTVSDYLKK